MVHALANRWWVFLIRGIAAIIFGILAFFWPGLTLITLTIVFGAYAFVDGVFALASAFGGLGGSRWWALLLEGIVGLVVALVVWEQPVMSATFLVFGVAVWAILTGIMEIIGGIQMRDLIDNEWLYIVGGILSIVFGVLVFRNPLAGGLTIAWLIGFYAIFFGLVQLGLSYRLSRLRSTIKGPVTA